MIIQLITQESTPLRITLFGATGGLTAPDGGRVVDDPILVPPVMLEPGTRTGSYRLSADALLVGPDGRSAISPEDFAVALLDEAERPRHRRRRFTVAY